MWVQQFATIVMPKNDHLGLYFWVLRQTEKNWDKESATTLFSTPPTGSNNILPRTFPARRAKLSTLGELTMRRRICDHNDVLGLNFWPESLEDWKNSDHERDYKIQLTANQNVSIVSQHTTWISSHGTVSNWSLVSPNKQWVRLKTTVTPLCGTTTATT